MGIPRLAGHLQPFSVSTTIGHKSDHIEDSSQIANNTSLIIDGPGLAYHLYYRLAHRSGTQSVFDAVPSYGEIAQAVLAFLSELEAHNVQMYDLLLQVPLNYQSVNLLHSTHIYFDGYLPIHKRDIRLARLESYLKDLVKLQYKYPNGFEVSEAHSTLAALPPSHLFNSFHSIPHALRRLPAPPILVPAVIGALITSKYTSVIEVVPGEADTYCASAARHEGGMILTSDSDMLVYDIGKGGAVILFSGLEVQEEDDDDATSRSSRLQATIYRTAEIAIRLEMPNLQRLAYEIKSDPTVGFAEARRRVKEPVKDPLLWQRFQEEYSTATTPSLSASRPSIQQMLDPRLSELIIQLSSSAERDEANIYLPFLVDDPSRASAWNVSSSIRHALYNMLASHISTSQYSAPPQSITEVSRKGLRIVASTVDLSASSSLTDQQRVIDEPDALGSRIRMVKSRFRDLSPMLQYRIFALKETYDWYIANDKNPPSRKLIVCAITGEVGSPIVWEDIHLQAQIEAVLYSLRMVKQSLEYIEKVGIGKFVELESMFEDLPPLSGLLPSRMELRGVTEKERIDVTEVVAYVMDSNKEGSIEEAGDLQ
ncbi:MAG: hypothetical protein Q9166_007487 [cf. Caloplaca sp. 2 TL-2023]